MNTDKKGNVKFGRMRFLASLMLSSPIATFVYSPLQAVQTVAGIAVPFATGRFIDSLVGGISPTAPFALLAALLFIRTAMTPCLQRLIRTCERKIELDLQGKVLYAVMDFPPSRLSTLADGSLVAKLTRDTYAVGGFVGGLYPRLVVAVVTMAAAGFALHSRSSALCFAFVAFIPFCIALFIPFARRFAANSHAVRKRSDGAFASLFDFFHALPFLRALDAERRFADAPRQSMRDLKDGNCALDHLTIAFGAILGAILVVGEVAVLGIVFQDNLIVTGTVRDNITLRDPMFTKDDIDEAVALSGLEEVVKRLPDGLDTRVGLRGQSLSGGEM